MMTFRKYCFSDLFIYFEYLRMFQNKWILWIMTSPDGFAVKCMIHEMYEPNMTETHSNIEMMPLKTILNK